MNFHSSRLIKISKFFIKPKCLVSFDKFYSTRILTPTTINPSIQKIEQRIQSWDVDTLMKKFPLNNKILPKDIIYAYVGDAQSKDIQPMTFFRQVLACASDPELIKNGNMPKDVCDRAKEFLSWCSNQTIGTYCATGGYPQLRKHIAEYIDARDEHLFQTDPDTIFVTNGATEAINTVLRFFATNETQNKNKVGIMVPIPLYSLYTAFIVEHNFAQVGYYLDENNNWNVNIAELKNSYENASKKHGIEPKILVVQSVTKYWRSLVLWV